MRSAFVCYARYMDHAHIRTYFLIIVTTLLTVLTVYMLLPFLATIGLAAVFAVIFSPINRRFEASMPRMAAALLTLLIAIACFALPLVFLGVQFFREAHNVYFLLSQPDSISHAQQALVSIGNKLDPTIPGARAYLDTLSTHLNEYVHQAAEFGLGYVGTFFTRTFSFLLQLIVFLMTLYYLLKEGPRLKRGIEKFSPLSSSETAEIFDRMVRTISSVMRGALLISLLQGVLTAIGFAIFGISNSVLWGTIAVLAALLPGIGVAIVFIPAVLYLLAIGHLGAGIGLALFGIIVIGAVDNLLRPYVLGSRSSIHPLLVLLSVFGGLAFFGPAGLFLGPLVISLLLGLLSIYAPGGRSGASGA